MIRRGFGAGEVSWSATFFARDAIRPLIVPGCGPLGAPASAGETRRFSSSMRLKSLSGRERSGRSSAMRLR